MQTRTQIRLLASTLVVAIASFSGVAQAHFNLVMPPPADNATDGGKGAPPCGPTTPSGVVTSVQGGHPITISVVETVFHPGHYRIALATSPNLLPPDPPVMTAANGNSISAAIQPAVLPVLADDVFDHTTGTAPLSFTTQVTLPNINCAKCSLQVIEFMAQHGLNLFPDGGVAGGYYYHHCADLAITADPNLPQADAGALDSGHDTSGGSGGTTGGVGGANGPGGATGTAGSTGSSGATGSSGGGGGSTGKAGSSGSSGAIGNADGGAKTSNSNSGCALAGRSAPASSAAATALLALGLAFLLRRRHR